jgi:hypothetical protein
MKNVSPRSPLGGVRNEETAFLSKILSKSLSKGDNNSCKDPGVGTRRGKLAYMASAKQGLLPLVFGSFDCPMQTLLLQQVNERQRSSS